MVESAQPLPSLISIVSVDGSVKTTLANWLAEELAARGRKPVLVWSRFRNYQSKPLLALTRLSGLNHYKTIEGVRFGFPEFRNLTGYRELYALLQGIDVNIAAYVRIHRLRKRSDVVVCERGPWDTHCGCHRGYGAGLIAVVVSWTDVQPDGAARRLRSLDFPCPGE